MKQEMIGWQWHQLDHMQIIFTSLQTDNHASTSSVNFLQAWYSSWCPSNSVKALKTFKLSSITSTQLPFTQTFKQYACIHKEMPKLHPFTQTFKQYACIHKMPKLHPAINVFLVSYNKQKLVILSESEIIFQDLWHWSKPGFKSAAKSWAKTTTTLYYYIHLTAAVSRTTWVNQHQKGKPFWILLEQEMMGLVS